MADWHPNSPASKNSILILRDAVSSLKVVPEQYFQLLQKFDGGEGSLGLQPVWLVLWSACDVVAELSNKHTQAEFPDYLFFASDGGVESIAFRQSGSGETEVVALDLVAGESSARVIAESFEGFASSIGKELK